MKTLQNIVMIAALALGGCATTQAPTPTIPEPVQQTQEKIEYHKPVEEKKQLQPHEELGISFNMLTELNGYHMSRPTEMELKIVSGIYAGTMNIDVQREGGRTTIHTMGFAPGTASEHMKKALKDADVDGNKLITEKEASDLYNKAAGVKIEEPDQSYSAPKAKAPSYSTPKPRDCDEERDIGSYRCENITADAADDCSWKSKTLFGGEGMCISGHANNVYNDKQFEACMKEAKEKKDSAFSQCMKDRRDSSNRCFERVETKYERCIEK